MVIIAASIPTLRALWKKEPRESTYVSDSFFVGGTAGSGPARPTASYVSTYRGSRQSKFEVNHTEEVRSKDSEEYILHDLDEDDEGITKTTEVQVSYNASSVSSLGGRRPSGNEHGQIVPSFLRQQPDRDNVGTAV